MRSEARPALLGTTTTRESRATQHHAISIPRAHEAFITRATLPSFEALRALGLVLLKSFAYPPCSRSLQPGNCILLLHLRFRASLNKTIQIQMQHECRCVADYQDLAFQICSKGVSTRPSFPRTQGNRMVAVEAALVTLSTGSAVTYCWVTTKQQSSSRQKI